jgi:putative peptidoglycan lipid II flippase
MAKKSFSKIINAAFILAFASLISRLLGVVRDRLIASEFGASTLLDSYYAAFRIPDSIFNLLILGALSSAFIPVFTTYLSKKDRQKSAELVHVVMTLTIIVLLIVIVLAFIFMPYIMNVVAPGLSAEGKKIAVDLSRIMLFSPFFFGISNIFSGILNSYKRFTAYAFAPVIYNIGIIIGAYVLSGSFGIYGLVYGVVIGSCGHMLVQLPSVLKLGYRFKPMLYMHEGVKQIGLLMIPRTLGIGVMQLSLFVTTGIASTLPEGSISIFNLANNLQSFPVGIFGISIAVSAFPFLAEAISDNNSSAFKKQFSESFSRILFFIIPLSILIWVLRIDIVRVFFGSGQFDWQDTLLTAESLSYFTFGLFASALVPLFARAFYAAHNTKTPVAISIMSMVVNIVLSFSFAQTMGVPGLALAFSIASIIQCILLLVFLRKEIGQLGLSSVWKGLGRITIASIALLIVAILVYIFSENVFDLATFFGVFARAALVTLFGTLMYVVVLLLFKDDQIRAILENITDFFKKYKQT